MPPKPKSSRAPRAVPVPSPAPPEREASAFSLEAYMPDEKTRVFNYNGRKLVSILGREDFPGERIFKLPTKVIEYASRQPLTASLLPCRVGYFPHAKGQKVSRPNGDWAFTLLFCLDGFGTLDLSDAKHRIGRGMIAVLRPFEFHAYEADEAQPWSYYWLHFNGTMAQQYYELLTAGGKNICVKTSPDIRFIQSFERILSIFHEGHAYKMLVQAAGAMHQLLGDLYGLLCDRGSAQESTKSRVERTLEVMQQNLNMHVSIHELASMANMSHAYYVLQFRRHTGESPRSYFSKLKIAKACEYLRKTDGKIENIAHLVGYEDPFYFCRLFKRIVGRTPTEYRRDPGPVEALALKSPTSVGRKASKRT